MASDYATISDITRFEAKVMPEPNSGCWLWTGAIAGNGYGNFWHDGGHLSAHVFAYRTFVGDVPARKELDHLCRVRSCCNPAHLEPVTHFVNVMRGASPTAVNATKTHCPEGHELTGGNLVGHWLRHGMRLCRTCYNARKREEYYRRRAA